MVQGFEMRINRGKSGNIVLVIIVFTSSAYFLSLSHRMTSRHTTQPLTDVAQSRIDSENSQSMFSMLFNLKLSDLLPWNTGDTELFHVEFESNLFGSTADVAATSFINNSSDVVIAIGGGITSRAVAGITESADFVAKFQFFNTFLPTFCATASSGYVYRFYFTYDHNDPVFVDPKMVQKFQQTFTSEILKHCSSPREIKTSLHLIMCDHTGNPAWAQNDAMLEAYLDHVDYFYRINDDTSLTTNSWTEAFIRVLRGYNPPKVGVVGPHPRGGSESKLEYDFVHRTHVDVFGLYYPRVFTCWWADDWITRIYRPNRSTMLHEVRLDHTKALGTRYVVRNEMGEELAGQLNKDRVTLERYIEAVRARNVSGRLSTASDGRRVIAMSLFGRDPRHTWGVIRNAQLVPVHFPGWRLRVYVPKFSTEMAELSVPLRVIKKLKQLGVDIARVSGKATGFSPRDWRLLVADDQDIDYFLIRDAESRLSYRDFSAVNEWIAEVEWNIKTGNQDAFPVHCIKDHSKHVEHDVVDGLWGGRPKPLHRILGTKLITPIHKKLLTLSEIYSDELGENETSVFQLVEKPQTVLETIIWPLIVDSDAQVVFHDVVSPCENTQTTTTTSRIIRRPFPVPRSVGEYVGQKYDEHEELLPSYAYDSSVPDIVCTDA